ncbi:NmrA family transcriptional regulator [Spirilliplanes yamanashiensis]|uniref:NmrA family transcriptional regulator n=2 Tax=Spirilliplanes yamanashiensis TaxID=42233 RepID=A0A8J3Y5E2_9ACTN|nr:NmrA family transcriptional regulator [Spirilliplanes yamanashiensis]
MFRADLSRLTQGMTERSNTHQNSPILVLGGTGKTGRRVVDRLTERGVLTRVGSRSAEIPFDWEDRSTWGPALEGVSAVYISFYPELAFPGATETIEVFTRTAVAAGARRLVLLSGRGEEEARASELVVERSGVAWTIVRASWFNQNFSENFLLGPVLSGDIALPAGDAAEPFVDADDIADVAVAALTSEGHDGQVYEVAGPRLLTFADVAKEISDATGRDVRYTPVSTEEYAAVLRAQDLPMEFVDLFTKILDGRNASLTDGVRRALGREPRDFRDYARATAATGVWG